MQEKRERDLRVQTEGARMAVSERRADNERTGIEALDSQWVVEENQLHHAWMERETPNWHQNSLF